MSFNPVTYRSLPDYSRLDSQRYIQPLDGRYDDGFTTQSLNERYESQRARINNADIISQTKNQGIQDQILTNLRDANAASLKGSFANKNTPSLLERLNALDNPTAAKPVQQVANNPLARLASALQPSQDAQQNPLFASLNRPDPGAAATGPNSLLRGEDFASLNLSLNPQVLQQRQQYVNTASLLTTLSNQGVDPRMAQAALAAQLGPQLAATGVGRMGAIGPMTQAMKTQASTELQEDKVGSGEGRQLGRMRKKMSDMLAKHQGSGLGQQTGQPQQNMQQLAQQIRQRQQTPALTA